MGTKLSGKDCMRILRKHGITRDEFAKMMGIKKSTMRTCVHGNRISRKMVAHLMEMEGEEEIKEELAEVNEMIEEVKAPIEEVRRMVEESDERMGKIYAIPQNKFLRLVEFADGSHGRFRCKPNKYLKLGEVIPLKHLEKDVWEVVKCG